jgi:hypothetical protein
MYLLRNSAANCSTAGAQTFTKSSQESSYHPRSLRFLRAAAPFNIDITMRTLTKQQVVSNFRDLWHDRLTHNPTLRGDRTAKRCAFNDYIDFLHKDKHLSNAQVTNWTNPF